MNLCMRSDNMQVSSSTLDIKPSLDEAPISKTMRYKKITKPLLERKRRARINACLDELKDIMTVALQAEGENVSKLEKADILELTVRHLHKLNQSHRLTIRNPLEELQKFQAGYSSCAQEAATFLLSTPGMDARVGQRLLGHLYKPLPGGNQSYSMFPGSVAQQSYPRPPGGPHVSVPDVKPGHLVHQPDVKPGHLVHQPDVKPVVSTQVLSDVIPNLKTVPVKPSPLRLTPTHTLFEEKVWKPYS